MAKNQLQCPLCDATFPISPGQENQRIACPSCHRTILVPAFSAPANDPPPAPVPPHGDQPINHPCSQCGKMFGVLRQMDGRPVRCPHCGVTLLVELQATAPVPPRMSPAPNNLAPVEQIEDDHVDLFPPGHPAANTRTTETQDPPAAGAPLDTEAASPAEPVAPIESEPSPPSSQAAAAASLEANTAVGTLVPPRFLVADPSINDLPTSAGEGVILLPDGAGGFQRVNRHTTRIQHHGKSVEIQALSKLEKERRRRIRGMIVFAICVVTLVITFLVLRSVQ